MSTNTNLYTYAMFANDVIALIDGEIELTDDKAEKIRAKATALLEQQVKKAEYNATHPTARKNKGLSPESIDRVNTIKAILSATPMTAAEISAKAGTDYTALQVANAVKYIDGAKSCKVIRDTVNSKGLKAQKEYTAYSIG